MALSVTFFFVLTTLLLSPLVCIAATIGKLDPKFYVHSCPKAKKIIKSIVAEAVTKEARMAASLLRLHFHDCFVKGCDASVLLDSSGTIISEKRSNPNRNSARGFEVIDKIKSALEKAGGPSWEVPLGRRDSLGASISGSNHNIPAPNDTLPTIITKFKLKGLNLVDLVTLSGSHTIGQARCTSFRQRLYNQTGKGFPDTTLNMVYANQLKSRCPRSGGDQNLFPLDLASPTKFDNQYFKNIVAGKGLLSSDEILFTKSKATMELVNKYAKSVDSFFKQFSKSMVKMGNITPLTGTKGEIRKHCRKINN
ncbi:peroxidase 72-like isoform X2 [Dioscorea cayenensis subsp. rotundata]|uniref:Peroxidase n=1 Tax=Dioscorea cayennensis subsp. rotundata TaxID=55577 RepID=A0AB40CUM3_DIOCR|nr:peroxidase 72-like isoform X2 [Dioscorea cayenensis subsp. rotundata]